MQFLAAQAARPLIVLLFFLVFSLLTGKLILMHGLGFPVSGDSFQYLAIAEGILNGNYPVVDSNIYPPGYPALLASIFALFGINLDAVYLVQFMLLSLIAWCVYLICRRHLAFSPLVAVLTGFIIVVWPYLILYSLLITTEILYTLLLTLSTLLVLEGMQRTDARFVAGAGALIGIATLTRPVALLLPFWVAGFLVLFCWYRTSLSSWWRHIAIGVIAFLITLTPWTIYVYTQTGVPTPVSTHFDSVYRRTMNLTYEPGSSNIAVPPAPLAEVVHSKIINIARFWNPGAGGTQAELLTTKFPVAVYAMLLYKVGYFVLLALAFLSLFYHHPRRWLLWVIVLYVWSVHTVLYPYPRYTLPIIPLMIILAGFSFTHLLSRSPLRLPRIRKS